MYNHVLDDKSNRTDRILSSTRTKFVTYRDINPELLEHNVYALNHRSFVSELYRLDFTRLRLSSHNLKIETGRWSRLPRERRLCPCGHVQDEKHVIEECELTEHLRLQYGHLIDYPNVLGNPKQLSDFQYLHDVLTAYQ